MPIYPYSFTMPPVNKQDIPSDGVVGEFLGISAGGVLDWLPVAGGGGGGDMLKADNLSGLADYAIARTNIGLGLTSSPEFANLTLTSPSLSSSAPVTISQTWGTTGTYTAFKVVATETLGAAAASNLLELWSGNAATLKVKVNKLGQLIVPPGTVSAPSLCFTTDKNGFYKLTNGFGYATDTNNPVLTANYNSALGMLSAMFLGWSTDVFTQPDWDVRLYKDGAGQLALRNGAAAQTFNVYGTYTSGSVYERMFMRYSGTDLAFQIGTETTGATLRPLDFVIGGTRRLMIGTTGNVGIGTNGAPVSTLELRKDAAINGPMMVIRSNVRVAGNWASISFGDDTQASAYRKGALIYESTSSSANGKFHIALNNDGTTADATLSDARLTVLPSGNVGIGTTAPGSALHISGQMGGNVTTYDSASSLKLTNTSGGVVSWLLSAGVIGIANNYFAIRQESTAMPALTIANATNNIGIGTTSPTSKLHVAETWNAAGTTFAAAKIVVTDTASAAASNLLELWSDSVTPTLKYSFGKSGNFQVLGGNSAVINCAQLVTNTGVAGNTDWGVYLTNSSGIILKDTLSLGWSSGVATLGADTILRRDGEADHLAMRRSTNGQKFSVYGTYPGAAWERFTITAPTSGNVLLGTYKGTGGIARGLEFQTDGVTRMTIDAAGGTVFGVGVTLATNNNSISGFRFFGLGSNNLLIDNGSGGFNRLTLGGTSSSYPALKRVGSEFQIVKADTAAADNVAAGDADLTFIEDRYRRKGAGTPEGVVTAPIGAVYHNTTGGAGTSFYVKESGTGNTGWVGK